MSPKPTSRPIAASIPRSLRMLPLVLLACAPLILAATAKAKGAAKGASFLGQTSETEPISFKTSANGKQILSFATYVTYDGNCGQGGGPAFEIRPKSIAIHNGKFAVKTLAGIEDTGIKVEPIKVTIKGTISGRKASGTIAEIGGHCTPANGKNPYSETFTVSAK
ncbi:MAG TPA: hypothetical protein VGF95_10320 [Solirubrobacteraceae bacterium]|jgi:hypothetical protein